jgi:aminomethyltransferase
MISVQGPNSRELLKSVSDIDLDNLKFFRLASGKMNGINCMIARVGFSGELGYECYFNSEDACAAWDTLMDAGKDYQLNTFGMDTLDSLRWEKGYIFYGFDVTDKNNPFEVGLSRLINFDSGDFVGREALLKIKEDGVKRKLVGLHVSGDATVSTGDPIKDGGKVIGEIVAGFFAPTVGKNMAYAYIDTSHSEPDSQYIIETAGVETETTVLEMPFYDPENIRLRG